MCYGILTVLKLNSLHNTYYIYRGLTERNDCPFFNAGDKCILHLNLLVKEKLFHRKKLSSLYFSENQCAKYISQKL